MVLATLFLQTNQYSVGNMISIMPAKYTFPWSFFLVFDLGWVGQVNLIFQLCSDVVLNTQPGRNFNSSQVC